MNKREVSYFINGDEPEIIGNTCQGFYLLQYQENGQIIDQANVTYLKFSNKWYRLYFDGSTVFWRSADKPEGPVNDNLKSILSLIDLSECNDFVGSKIQNISYSGNYSSITVKLAFNSGKTIKLQYDANEDTTYIKC